MALKPLNSVGGFSVGEIPANVILANADITANKGTFVGNVSISNSNPAYGLLTDNIYYANGTPWNFGQDPGGSNTQVQFNNNGTFGASANFTFDPATNLLTVIGNSQFNNANLGNLATANYVNVANAINLAGGGTANLGNLVNANYVNVSSNLISGNVTVNNEFSGNTANFSGNVILPNLTVNSSLGGNTANFSGNVILPNLTVNSTLAGNTANFSGNVILPNLTVNSSIGGNTANFSGNVVLPNLNVNLELQANTANFDGNVVMDNWLTVSNTANVGNLRTDNLLYANGQPWDLQEAAGSNTQVQFNSNNNFGASANFTFNDATNVLTVNGNANVTNTLLTPNINSGTSDLKLTANGQTATFAAASGNFTFPGNVIAGTFYGNVSANITVTAANTSVLYSDSGLISGASGFTFNRTSNAFNLPGDLIAAGNANITGSGNINNVTIQSGNIQDTANNGIALYGANAVRLNYNNQQYVVANSAGVTLTNGSGSLQLDTTGNVSMSGNLSVTGNIANVNNISVTNNVNAVIGNFSGNINSLNANLGNLAQANFVNAASNVTSNNVTVNLELAANTANFSGNVILPNLSVNSHVAGNTANFTGNVVLSGGNVTVNNQFYGNTANFSGNITSLNATLGNLADANYIRTGELMNGNSNIVIAPNGNISLSATGAGNVLVVSNVGANIIGYVTANGDGTFGAVKSNTVTAQGGNLTIYAAAGNNYVELRPTGTGQVDVGNHRIENLATPVASTDAATKGYVDAAVEGLHIHAPCAAATPNTLATISGGTVTYNNGTAGVGATLTTTGTYTSIDNVNIATIGTRILVKNEANAAHNGIYVYTSSTVLTRASDFDTPTEMAGGDFTFVQNGTIYNDTGWVMTDPVTTVGTSPVNFLQFSGAGEYSAGAGLTLTGTVFSVNVDNVTTEIAGGNVVVKANAQLTTPNIGAATGTSLDLTGNLLAGNVNSNALVSAANVNVTANVLAGNLTANANLLVNNATVNLELSGNTANFSGNVIVPNLTVNSTLSGNVANFTGNLTAANANLGNLATANFVNVASNVTSNNVTVNLELAGNTANFSGNVLVNNFTTNLELVGNTANFSGNVVLPNLKVNLELAGSTANFSGNVVAANFVTSGVANVAQLNVTGNVTSDLLPNANLSHDLGSSTLRWDNVYAGNIDASGNLTIGGNLSSNNFTANILTANTQVNVGTTAIRHGNVTTTSITANQAISTVPVSGITGIEWIVKGVDSSGLKYSMAMVTAVTDGTSVDYSTFGTVNLGATTGSLAVNISGSNVELQVTPATSNSTVWVTQYRTI